MIYYVPDKNLAAYNARLKREGANIKYNFAGYMSSSGVGYARQTRHYIAEILSGENAGATTGDYKEIVFGADYEHTGY
jgi:hypothetical protein